MNTTVRQLETSSSSRLDKLCLHAWYTSCLLYDVCASKVNNWYNKKSNRVLYHHSCGNTVYIFVTPGESSQKVFFPKKFNGAICAPISEYVYTKSGKLIVQRQTAIEFYKQWFGEENIRVAESATTIPEHMPIYRAIIYQKNDVTAENAPSTMVTKPEEDTSLLPALTEDPVEVAARENAFNKIEKDRRKRMPF